MGWGGVEWSGVGWVEIEIEKEYILFIHKLLEQTLLIKVFRPSHSSHLIRKVANSIDLSSIYLCRPQ